MKCATVATNNVAGYLQVEIGIVLEEIRGLQLGWNYRQDQNSYEQQYWKCFP
jgi:hypothetical protein